MHIDTVGLGGLWVVLIMAVVTLATRWGGVWLMAHVPLNERVKQCISAMSGSVLVAVLTPLAANGDGGARLALATTAVTMLAWRKPLPAIMAGIVAAALFRHV